LATINTNFSISPDSVYVTDPIPLGRDVDLKVERHTAMKVINQSDDLVRLHIAAAAADPNNTPQQGYIDAPDYKWMDVSPNIISLPGNSIKEIRLHVKIPDKPENRNKKMMFIVQTTLADESLPLAYNNMLYVTTAP
jgi:hypothetical protein